MKHGKKTPLRERKCKYPKCHVIFTPLSEKGAYHDQKCRFSHDRERREERDALFNAVIKKMKRNYKLLLLYKDQTIVTFKELVNLDFCFNSCPCFECDVNGAISDFGNIVLRDLENGTFKIEFK
jgi:hypothetical protein